MNPPATFSLLAGLLLNWILICLAGGTILAGAITVLLQLAPKKNSRTRFAVWFSTLMGIAALPIMGVEWRPHHPTATVGNALITVPSAWATFITLSWVAVVVAGLVRIVAGLWSLRRLRRGCTEVPSHVLSAELQEALTTFRRSRPVTILVSPRVQVPGAIGFLQPAILLPSWLLEDPAATELKYVVLHELAHLERWDDWSNLAQKLVKAILFFHPGVWWIERNLALDREMACDDNVIARGGSARVYAECLARVAEKSFLRRQFSLAQAAVDRVRQLSARVASILNEDEDQARRRGTQLWKPALPIVTVFALLCAISASRVPELIRVSNSEPIQAATVHASVPAATPAEAARVSGRQVSLPDTERVARAAHADLNSGSKPPSLVPALFSLPNAAAQKAGKRPSRPARIRKLTATSNDSIEAPLTVNAESEANAVVVVFVTNQIVTVTESEVGSSRNDVVHVHVLELRWIVPANPPSKQIPRKT